MSLRALPVFDRLIRDRMFTTVGVNTNDPPRRFKIDDELAQMFVNAHRISCTYEIEDPAPREGAPLNMERILGHSTIPFPVTWIEWQMPDWRDSALLSFIRPNMRAAALCLDAKSMLGSKYQHWQKMIAEEPAIDINTSWEMCIFVLTNQGVVQLPGGLDIALDREGTYLGCRSTFPITDNDMAELSGWGMFPNPEEGSDAAFADAHGIACSVMVRLGYGALKTAGWLNCRNVSTERHQGSYTTTERKPSRNPARRGKAVRKKHPVDYHTIKLPGGAVGGSSGGGGGSGGDVRLHTVRGHFKTFTKDAPLLGRHTGTYWWGWQLRGNRDRGVVVSDYEVGAQ